MVQQIVASTPWFQHHRLLDKLRTSKEREWYIRKSIENDCTVECFQGQTEESQRYAIAYWMEIQLVDFFPKSFFESKLSGFPSFAVQVEYFQGQLKSFQGQH